MNFYDLITKPWPWYIAGPLIGLTVPLLLLIGNKPFGLSSSLAHICNAALRPRFKLFQYNWKEEAWSLLFVLGIIIGSYLAAKYFIVTEDILISNETIEDLRKLGISDFSGYLPYQIFGNLSLSVITIIFCIFGGFLVGFGTRYANGCTSGHSITGIANLNWPSLVATICFMIGGISASHILIPLFLKFL
ncbi:MAG: hypothetical protein RLZZ546_81 [Bacteroidota bacterium]|jgi:uncharacterized membrane protein YedE/YeeE